MKKVDFLKTAKRKYKRYGLHVLGFRHFPEGRDGLTPVQRRALWSLYSLGATDRSKKVATARAVGDCTGRFHPHEDESVYSAMVKISQAKTLAPTVMGVGNWGTWDDPAAAKRYTKCYLSKYAMTFFDSDELSQVPMDSTYDGSEKEPRFLPSPLPHLLLHGTEGIAPGARANVPPSTVDWVLKAVEATVRGKKLSQPTDFGYRYGGIVQSLDKSYIKTGRGSASFRPKIVVDEKRRAVVLHSLAPGMNPYTLDDKLSALPQYGGMSSEPSAENEICILLLCKKGHDLVEFKREVAKYARYRDSFSFFYITQSDALDQEVQYKPMVGSPRSYLQEWVEWRRKVVAGAAAHRIEALKRTIARHQLMIRVIAKRKELLAILEKGKSRDEMRTKTAKLLACSAEDADFVLNSALYRLATLEVASLKEKIAAAEKQVKENAAIVKAPDARLLADASKAAEALRATQAAAEDIRRGEMKKRKNRRARSSRG